MFVGFGNAGASSAFTTSSRAAAGTSVNGHAKLDTNGTKRPWARGSPPMRMKITRGPRDGEHDTDGWNPTVAVGRSDVLMVGETATTKLTGDPEHR